jgi:hypothetical protein
MSSVVYLEFENARYEYALSCEEYKEDEIDDLRCKLEYIIHF